MAIFSAVCFHGVTIAKAGEGFKHHTLETMLRNAGHDISFGNKGGEKVRRDARVSSGATSATIHGRRRGRNTVEASVTHDEISLHDGFPRMHIEQVMCGQGIMV